MSNTHTVKSSAFKHRAGTPQERYRMPPGAKELILVRHGSTDLANAGRLSLGGLEVSNPLLLPAGREQAKAVARRLGNLNLSAIFITPLHRTGETAMPLVELTGLEPIVIEELREVYMGDWEHDYHIKAAEGGDIVARMFAEETFDVVPNAEKMAAVSARVKIGIEKIVTLTRPDTSAVVVSHGGTIAEICRQATHSRPFAFFGPENTSISRLVIHSDGHWSLRSFNDVSHLDHIFS